MMAGWDSWSSRGLWNLLSSVGLQQVLLYLKLLLNLKLEISIGSQDRSPGWVQALSTDRADTCWPGGYDISAGSAVQQRRGADWDID